MLTCTEFWIINSFPKRKQTISFKPISLLNTLTFPSIYIYLLEGLPLASYNMETKYSWFRES